MTQGVDAAIVGAGALGGEQLVELLEEREFPLRSLRLYSDEERIGERLAFRGQYLRINPLDNFPQESVPQLLFVTAGSPAVGELAERVASQGALVIDAAAALGRESGHPCLVPGVNEVVLEGRRVVRVPHPAVVMAAEALAPLHREAGVRSADLFLMKAVSAQGKGGVEELASQTANLLNARSASPRLFSQQIAFNLLPSPDGAEAETICAQLSHLFGDQPRFGASVIQAPVFFGHALTLHVTLGREIPLERVTELLGGVEGGEIVDESGGPTPVGEAASDTGLFFAPPRRLSEGGVALWCVADNIRHGIALSSVRIAELLAREYL